MNTTILTAAFQKLAQKAGKPVGAAPFGDGITHTLRRLEPWVAWSIAVYTASLAVFSYTGVAMVWLFVLYAGIIGKWAELKPARSQSDMAARGVALVVGAYLLQTKTGIEIGSTGGPFMGWLGVTCLFYAFMLKPAWGAGIVALAMVEFTMASMQTAVGTSPADLIAQASYLCIFPALLAMKFGAVMRAPDETLENARVDTATALYNKTGFVAHGNDLLAQSRRERRQFSVAVFNCADLVEVRNIYGNQIARKLLARIVGKLMILTADRGFAARTGPAEFTVVLPGLGRDKAIAAIQRVLGAPTRIELDSGDSEIVLVPAFQVGSAGTDTDSVETLYNDLCLDIADMEAKEQRHVHHVQRERERHSRPMSSSPAELRSESAFSLPAELRADPAPRRFQLPADTTDRRFTAAQLAPTVPAALAAC